MKSLRMILAIVLAVGMLASLAVGADEAKKMEGGEGAMPPMGPPEEMKACAPMVGDWTFKGEWRMSPDMEWTPMTAEVTFAYELDGAVLRMDLSAEMMGMTMHGIGYTAYNRETKLWQEMWTDNLGGAISLYTGTMTEDGKRVMQGVDVWNGQEVHSRSTSSDMTDTTFKWMMEHSIDGGKSWYTGMQGTYTKK